MADPPHITAHRVNWSPSHEPGQLSLLRGEFWVGAQPGVARPDSVGRTGPLWESCSAKPWPVAVGSQGQVSAGCRAHMQWEVLSTAAFPLQDCSWGWVWFPVSFLSQGWRQTPWRKPRLYFMASRSRETQRQSRLALPGLTGQRPSFPDPETSWAPPGHPCQVSQIRPDCFLTPHITHTPGNTKQRCGCAPQIHPCLQVFNCFHSALLHANFFQNDLSKMMGWEVF